MKKIIITLAAIFGLAIAASAANYSIDESSIDSMFADAVEMTVATSDATASAEASVKIGSSVNPVVAWILSFIPVTGWLAIHRMYMGTSVLAVILNIVTGAGFGIVYVVDWVVLLIKVIDGSGIGEYCGNPRWWMWANII